MGKEKGVTRSIFHLILAAKLSHKMGLAMKTHHSGASILTLTNC